MESPVGATQVWHPPSHDKGPSVRLLSVALLCGVTQAWKPLGPGDTEVWHHPGAHRYRCTTGLMRGSPQ